MNKNVTILAAALLAAVFAAPVAAQDRTITLQVDTGTVFASDGVNFVGASSGKVVVPGQRLMVAEDSAGRLVYTDADGGTVCTTPLTDPGVYVVTDGCRRVAAFPFDTKGLAIVLGTTAVAAAILAGKDTVPATGVLSR